MKPPPKRVSNMTRWLSLLALGFGLGHAAAPPPAWACAATQLDGPRRDATTQLHAVDRQWPQTTELVTPATLQVYMQNRLFDLLIFFCTPYCNSCRYLVSHNASGNPLNAPIEQLNKDMVMGGRTKVLKYDISASGHPLNFEVNDVPTIFLFTKLGIQVRYLGNTYDMAAVKDFAASGGTRNPPAGPNPTVPPVTLPVTLHAKSSLRKSMPGVSSWGNDVFNDYLAEDNCKVPSTQPLQLHIAKKQEVEAATWSSLQSYMGKKSHNLLVVFYAPWCGHCKQFVIGEKAPLESLNEDLLAAKGPTVLKYDCEANGWPDQAQFPTEYVPTIYSVKTGTKRMYGGGSLDLISLKAFALQ